MNKRDKERRERQQWHAMSVLGKRSYLLKPGILKRGLLTGISFGILLHVSYSGFHFLNFNFISRIIIGSLVFTIGGYLEELFTWEKYKKKYS